MSDEERKELKEQLNLVNNKLKEQKILIDTSDNSASSGTLTKQQKENHSFSLNIPNELYILWEKKIYLQKKLGTDPSSLTEMVNDLIEGQLYIRAPDVEERLQRKSTRFRV